MKSNVSLILVRREVDLRLNQERPMWRLGRISALPTLAALIQSSLVDWEISSHSINLNKCHLTIFFPEKAMAAHSSTLAWKIPWTEEPSGLQSMGSLRVGHDWVTSLSHALEKEMATHSSVLAWRIPGTEEPGGLPSMGSHRVGHDCSDLAAAAAYLLHA